MSDNAELIKTLIRNRAPRLVWLFNLGTIHDDNWKVVKALPTVASEAVTAAVYLLGESNDSGRLVRYEIMETRSVREAVNYCRGLAGRDMTAGRLQPVEEAAHDAAESSASFSWMDTTAGKRTELMQAHFNLVFVAHSATSEPVNIEDLGNLLPRNLLQSAMQSTLECHQKVTGQFSKSAVKRGEEVEIEITCHGSELLWFMFVVEATKGQADISRSNDRVVLHVHENFDASANSLTVYWSWFDHHGGRQSGLPLTIDVA